MRVRARFQFFFALDSGLSWSGGAFPSNLRLRATATENRVIFDSLSSSSSSELQKKYSNLNQNWSMLWVRVCVCYVYKWGKLENLDRWLQTIESPMCYLKKIMIRMLVCILDQYLIQFIKINVSQFQILLQYEYEYEWNSK